MPTNQAPAPDWSGEDSGDDIPLVIAPAVATVAAEPPVATQDAATPPPPVIPPIVLAPAPEPEPDNFPTDLSGAFKLLTEMQPFDRIPFPATEAQKANQRKLHRLRRHVMLLQNPALVLHHTSHSPGAFIGVQSSTSDRYRLLARARTDIDIKRLLAAVDEKDLQIQQLTAKNAALEARLQTAK